MKNSIGLEIGGQYLKIAIARFQGVQPVLSECIIEPVSSLADNLITDKILESLRKFNLGNAPVAVSIPRSFATVRNLHLPSQDRQEIAQMIDLHIGRVVPYKKEDMIVGHYILGKDDIGYTKVILAILDSNTIRRRIKMLENAGLIIDSITLSSYGIWQWVLNNHRAEINHSDIYLILDIDSLFTDFIMFAHGNLLFSRGITMGANEAATLSQPGMSKFIGEIKQSLLIFNNEEVSRKPAMVFLSGANIPEALKKLIQVELGLPVKSVNIPDLLKKANPEILRVVSFASVAQLALDKSSKNLLFILPEMQIKKALQEKMRNLVILGSLCLYFFSVTCVLFLGSISSQQSYLKKLSGESSMIEKDMGGLMQQLSRIAFVKDYLFSRRVPLYIMGRLQKIIPDEIAVNYFNIDEQGRVILRGQASSLSDVFKFSGILEKEKYFIETQTKYTRTKKVKDKELAEFELNFKVQM